MIALISNTVINQSYSDKAMWISLPIQVDYGTDLDQARPCCVNRQCTRG
jgi:small-conductance mechanosensitive channel